MPHLIARRAGLAMVLVIFLASVYMLTYSGRIESGDSLSMFDATSSLAQFGDTLLDQSLWFNPPSLSDFQHQPPFSNLEVESLSPNLQPFLALPLYQVANRLPGVGLVHTVWLFSILATAGTGGLLFLYVLALGYGELTGVLATLAFGVGTIAFPYSKTFFREPLTMFLILLAALFIQQLVKKGYGSLLLWAGIVAAIMGILMTKTSAAFGFPGLVIIGLPPMENRFKQRKSQIALDLLFAALLMVPFIAIYSGILSGGPNYEFPFIGRLNVSPFYMRTALHSYLLSIGGSVWATSPIVLLAVPGGWMLWRQGKRRTVWVAALMTIGYAFGYAILSNKHWFGGLSWPPRFLTPVIPFLILVTLPVIDYLIQRRTKLWWKAAAGILIGYSLWIQVCAVSLELGKYPDALPPEAGQLIEWSPGLNTLQYLRWVVIPRLWGHEPLDFAWLRVGALDWAISFTLLATACGCLLWYGLRKSPIPSKIWGGIGVGLPLLFVILSGVGLHRIVGDPVYLGSNPALNALMPILKAETNSHDVVLLSNNSYERFFLNSDRLDARVVTLPFQPGERPSEAQLPRIVSDNPDDLLTTVTPPLIYRLAQGRDRLWLVEDSGPFIPWSVRPVERFMTVHYYPIREIQTVPPDPTVRLIEYSTVNAPDPYAFRSPEHLTDLVYGDSIHLVGYTLASGTTYGTGGILPISLYWQTSGVLKTDYTVAWFLVNAETHTVAVQGMDSPPASGFSPTSGWQVGVPLWDNRAMRLPSDLPPGTYQLWISLYSHSADGIERLPVKGETVTQAASIGVLPTLIQVVQP